MYRPQLLSDLKGYNKTIFSHDLFAGLTVGVVALPLAMAFAIASGLGPERGLYTAIVAGFLMALLGGSSVQVGGPTGAFVVIVSSILAAHGFEGLVICTAMAGLLLILFGLCRMGGLIRFIPFPVTTGFTAGIAVTIFSTQVKDLLGLQMNHVPAAFLAKWQAYFAALPTLHMTTLLLGLFTIVVIVALRRFAPHLPAMLIAMCASTLLAVALNLDVATIGSTFGDLPRSLPQPSFTLPSLQQVQSLISPALTVALLAAIESLLSATVADGMTGGRHRPDTELIGLGIANIASVCFGGIPATGAIARTATNVKSGARTPLASMIHAVTLALLLLLLAPAARLIPLCSLAGILMVVSWGMSEAPHFVALCRGPRSDALVLVLTFLLTVLVDLTVAVQVGVVLAALLFIHRLSSLSQVRSVTENVTAEHVVASQDDVACLDVPRGVEVFEIAGPFFFGTAETFREALGTLERPPQVVVLRARFCSVVDATALHALKQFVKRCKAQGTTVILSGLAEGPLATLRQSSLISELGEANITPHIDAALRRTRELIEL